MRRNLHGFDQFHGNEAFNRLWHEARSFDRAPYWEDVRPWGEDRAFKPSDVVAKSTTTAAVAVGGTYTGVIDFRGDVDWIKVNLVAGKTYSIDEIGSQDGGSGTLYDPNLVGIYNAKSKLVAYGNDDFMGSLNSHISFTPTSSGTYFIAASAYGSYQGTYQLRVTDRDTTSPTLISASPADEAASVAVNSNIVFQFSETVQLGSGTIAITDGVTSHTFSGSELSIIGNTLTINPAADLDQGIDYSILFSGSSVVDLSGNSYAGLSSYNFHTASASPPSVSGTWNIMLYMAADNNLESFGLYNLNQIESVALPTNVKVTALVDRIAGDSSGSGNWTDTRFGFIQKDNNTSTVTSLASPGTEKDMGSPTTLTNFIVDAKNLYTADHNMLIIWDHGGGLDGAAWDDTSGGDNLTIKEMAAAISASGVHFDIIGFDACLMAMTEIVYSLSSFCDYFVGSQDLEPGNGWSYDQWLALFKTNSDPSALAVANAAVSTYAAQYPSDTGITLSAVSTAYNTQLTNALKAFSDYAVTANSSDLGVISAAARSAQAYPVDPGYNYNYGDLENFMNKVYANTASTLTLKADALAVMNVLQNMVISEAGTVSAATGLSIYLPAGSDVVDTTYNASNFDFLAGVPNWDNMLLLI